MSPRIERIERMFVSAGARASRNFRAHKNQTRVETLLLLDVIDEVLLLN
jgi:hypothetical protein